MAKGIRSKEKQIWIDGEFKDKLETLQAKKKIATGKKVSLGELSKEIVQAKCWEQLEREILELDKKTTNSVLKLNVKFDGDIN